MSKETKQIKEINNPLAQGKLFIIAKALLILSFGLFSIVVSWVAVGIHREVSSEMPLAPISRFVLDFQVLIHVPVLILIINAILCFVRKGHANNFVIDFISASVFALLAAIWLLGLTLPFITIPVRIGG